MPTTPTNAMSDRRAPSRPDRRCPTVALGDAVGLPATIPATPVLPVSDNQPSRRLMKRATRQPTRQPSRQSARQAANQAATAEANEAANKATNRAANEASNKATN